LADRRREVERRAARPEATSMSGSTGADWLPILHEEIDRLPDRYRVPVVLCDLEGRSYEEAARHMDCPIGTIMSRLARGRQRLQGRLTRRGLASALAAPAAALSVEASAGVVVPTALAASIVGGSVSESVMALVTEVSTMIVLTKIKTVVVGCLALVLVGGGSLLAWQAVPNATDGRQPVAARQVVRAQKPQPKPVEAKPKPVLEYQFVGSVKVEGTGEPVKGATFGLILGDGNPQFEPWRTRDIRSGDDGMFAVDIPAGQARAWTFFSPPGYWMPNNGNSQETFIVSASQPVHRKDYLVRRGTIWNFQLDRGKDRKAVSGGVVSSSTRGESDRRELFWAESDDAGLARLTLPVEGGKFSIVAIPEKRSWASASISLESDPLFLPDAVKTVNADKGRIHLIDGAGKTAFVTKSERIDPIVEGGKLLIRVALPEEGPKATGIISGRVVDEAGRRIANARVRIGFGDARSSAMTGPETTTDAQGDFKMRIPSIPRDAAGKNVSQFFAVVTKDGYAGVDTPRTTFRPGADGSPQVLAPIVMKPGGSLERFTVA
jgi:hypothetical protein